MLLGFTIVSADVCIDPLGAIENLTGIVDPLTNISEFCLLNTTASLVSLGARMICSGQESCVCMHVCVCVRVCACVCVCVWSGLAKGIVFTSLTRIFGISVYAGARNVTWFCGVNKQITHSLNHHNLVTDIVE